MEYKIVSGALPFFLKKNRALIIAMLLVDPLEILLTWTLFNVGLFQCFHGVSWNSPIMAPQLCHPAPNLELRSFAVLRLIPGFIFTVCFVLGG